MPDGQEGGAAMGANTGGGAGASPPPSGDPGNTPDVGNATPGGGSDTQSGAGSATNEALEIFERFIPEELKNEEHIANLRRSENPLAELFKMNANAQKAVYGKNYSVPDDKATPEQKQAFYQAMGVPESPEKYELKTPDWKPEEKEAAEFLAGQRTPEFLEGIKKLAHENNIPASALNALLEGHDRLWMAQHGKELEAVIQARKEITEDFQVEFDRMFPGQKGAEATQTVKGLLEKYANVSRPHITDMPGKYLAVMSEVLMGVVNEHLKPDTVRSLASKDTARNDLNTPEGIREEIKRIRLLPEYNDQRSPKYTEVRKQVDGLYMQEIELSKAARRR